MFGRKESKWCIFFYREGVNLDIYNFKVFCGYLFNEIWDYLMFQLKGSSEK